MVAAHAHANDVQIRGTHRRPVLLAICMNSHALHLDIVDFAVREVYVLKYPKAKTADTWRL